MHILLAKFGIILYNIVMKFEGVKSIAIYGVSCIADISRGDGDETEFVSAKEKYFDIKLSDGALTVAQKSRNLLARLLSRRLEFKLILPKSFKGKLRFRNKNGGSYILGGGFTEIELATDNGKFEISDVACTSLVLKMQNGSATVKKLSASKSAELRCRNGNIRLESVTAPTVAVGCANASITAVDVTAKKIDLSTANGTVDASAINADDTRLETSNGKILTAPLGTRNDFKLSAETLNGSISIDGTASKKISDVVGAPKKLAVKTGCGDIDIRFV